MYISQVSFLQCTPLFVYRPIRSTHTKTDTSNDVMMSVEDENKDLWETCIWMWDQHHPLPGECWRVSARTDNKVQLVSTQIRVTVCLRLDTVGEITRTSCTWVASTCHHSTHAQTQLVSKQSHYINTPKKLCVLYEQLVTHNITVSRRQCNTSHASSWVCTVLT